jgi:hypothetical protein
MHVEYFLGERQQMRLTCFYGANIWGQNLFRMLSREGHTYVRQIVWL